MAGPGVNSEEEARRVVGLWRGARGTRRDVAAGEELLQTLLCLDRALADRSHLGELQFSRARSAPSAASSA